MQKRSTTKKVKSIIKFSSGKKNTVKQLAKIKAKNNKLAANCITYTYAIFPTKKGKGYGCFAVQPHEGGFLVAASFCAPSDRAKFSKTKARDVACKRLKAKSARLIDGDPKEERNRTALKEIILDFMLSYENLPRWISDSISAEIWLHTLKQDSLPSREIVNAIVKEQTGMDDAQVEVLREVFAIS
ncbi:MAG TPA: hypothetical protein VMX17_08980 [Candidatus Glassbacteria bacterium]|nr:hypothetical protein [Candidatus Glassbacteria bacterium]